MLIAVPQYFVGVGTKMEGLRVLLVDDELDYLDSLIKRLVDRGFNAVGVTSGSQALALLDTQDFDVALLDYRMPGMDGVETLREMVQKRPRLAVIMLTGQSVSDLGVQGLDLPDENYFVKPIFINDLVAAIHRAHERKLEGL